MGQLDDFLDFLDAEDLVTDREAGHRHQRYVFGLAQGLFELADADGVDEIGAGVFGPADNASVAAGGRNPDHRLARPGQYPRRRHDGGGLAVEDHDRVRFRVAAKVIQRQFVQAIRQQRRRQFVVERRQAVVRGLEAPLQAAEVIDSVES